MPIKRDLHSHSTHSDGRLTPEELVIHAKHCGIDVLALTDHDTVSGIAEAKRYAERHGLSVVSGVELSVRWVNQDIHIVGLNIDEHSQHLIDVLKEQARLRQDRAVKIGDKLAEQGISDMYQAAQALAGSHGVTRPHFARVLVERGICKDIPAAFKRYLKRGRLAYVPTQWVSLADAVSAIGKAGGQSVVAHPMRYKLTKSKLGRLLTEFKLLGGDALEVISAGCNTQEIHHLASLCRQYGLMASTGSDFHGPGLSYLPMGHDFKLPDSCTPVWSIW